MDFKEMFEAEKAFSEYNPHYRQCPLFRALFIDEEQGEFAREVISAYELLDNKKLIPPDLKMRLATEAWDKIFNLIGTLRVLGVDAATLQTAARSKIKKNMTRKFPTH